MYEKRFYFILSQQEEIVAIENNAKRGSQLNGANQLFPSFFFFRGVFQFAKKILFFSFQRKKSKK